MFVRLFPWICVSLLFSSINFMTTSTFPNTNRFCSLYKFNLYTKHCFCTLLYVLFFFKSGIIWRTLQDKTVTFKPSHLPLEEHLLDQLRYITRHNWLIYGRILYNSSVNITSVYRVGWHWTLGISTIYIYMYITSGFVRTEAQILSNKDATQLDVLWTTNKTCYRIQQLKRGTIPKTCAYTATTKHGYHSLLSHRPIWLHLLSSIFFLFFVL